jgi:nitrite reductase/ring-hydroxylating ferredoxin subunit
MLVTQQKVLRRFWYALMPMAHLDDGPKPFRLLGTDLVLWKQADGTPAALADRCCHRTAKLSRGFVENGHIVCGYHGWTYDCSGACVRIPQQPDLQIPAGARVPSYRAQEKYGYVWVALEESTVENGCLRVIPRSHVGHHLHEHLHEDRTDLTLNQRMADGTFDESQAVDLELQPGQMSLHDVYMIHGAAANTSGKRRTGAALRYMPATSVFERNLRPVDGKTGIAVNFANRPLWLLRGVLPEAVLAEPKTAKAVSSFLASILHHACVVPIALYGIWHFAAGRGVATRVLAIASPLSFSYLVRRCCARARECAQVCGSEGG